jgi:hypothetical protein
MNSSTTTQPFHDLSFVMGYVRSQVHGHDFFTIHFEVVGWAE